MKHPLEFSVTPSVLLQSVSPQDIDIIFTAIDENREELRQWLPFVDSIKDAQDTENFISQSIAEGDYIFTIFYDESFAGLIGFRDADIPNQKVELGYWILEEFRGNGIISRSVEVLTHYAFTEMGINRIQAKVAVGNDPSRRVVERLNFTLEGIERESELLSNGTFTNLALYSLLKSEYKLGNFE